MRILHGAGFMAGGIIAGIAMLLLTAFEYFNGPLV